MASVIGTWRLVKAVSRDPNGEELPPPYGGHGMGRVVLGADGRMMAVLCDGRKEIPQDIKREYSSYCGNYTFDGRQLITRVDAALDQSRIGGEQVRDVRFEGGLMVLRPPVRSYGGAMEQRELFWAAVLVDLTATIIGSRNCKLDARPGAGYYWPLIAARPQRSFAETLVAILAKS